MLLGVAGFYGLAALGVQAAISSFVPLQPAHASDPTPARVSMDGLPVEALRAPSKIDYQRVDQRLARLAEKPDMVGLAVAIIENGEIAFVKGYGVTAAGTTDPVGVRTVFRWASLSKGLAATVVGELAAEKRLSLSDPVSRYAPSLHLPGGSEGRVTLDDLLAHRVGLVHNAYDDRLEAGQDPRQIRAALGSLAAFCAPGACHGYQNVAFDAASETVEAVTGEPYAQVVREKLFAPLGMADASVTRDGLMSAPSWARPHVGRTTMKVDEAYYRVPAAGGVNSSIFDLALWMRAQMGLATSVLPQAVLDEIHRPRVATDRRNGDFSRAMGQSHYALGWRDYDYAGHRLIGHQGAVQGYRSTILFDPVTRSGVAVLWNSQSNRPSAFQLEILEMLYGQERHDWLKLDENRASGARIAAR
ncbi:MAG: serine hydrolase [Sphingomonas sp. SCN 67-18]|nr:serine hydrolase domain-containing protein [Sphingomonas sp. SCN 67-18]ODU20797.1 MAG: serine hydrolase [Sphingomonas sp. SCN 67-18]